MNPIVLPTLFAVLTSLAGAQVPMDWTTTGGGTLGSHTVTASGFGTSALASRNFNGPNYSGAPLLSSQETVRFAGNSNWTLNVSPAIDRLLWYGDFIRGQGANSTGQPVLYVFSEPFEILSGFDQGTVFATTLRLPSTGLHQGILRFTGTVSSLTCATNNVGTDPQYCTLVQYERDLGTLYCSPAVPNSTGVPAEIQAFGSDYSSDNLLTVSATALAQNSFAYFLTSRTQAQVSMPGGSAGTLCLGGAIGRYVSPGQIMATGLFGEAELALDLTLHPTPNGLIPVVSGDTWSFQCWYRDSVGGIPGSNFSDGLSITFR